MRILLVDDNEELRGTTREMLEGLGHRVVEAGSGEEAVDRVSEGAGFELLVTDFSMPGMDGLELADRLRHNGRSRGVVVISSNLDEPRIHRRVESGELGFVAKPFGLAELRAAIDSAGDGDSGAGPSVATEGGGETGEGRSGGFEPRRAPSGIWLGVVAALALALTVALAVRLLDPGPPTLPEPPAATSPSRGTELEILEPAGLLAEIPSALHWRPQPGAAAYRVTLEGVDDTVLWRSEIGGEELAEQGLDLPTSAAEQLLPAVAYYWRVDALDADGTILASSPRTRFRTLPPAPEDGG